MLTQAMRSGTPIYMNVINLGEIVYATKRTFGDQKKIEVLAHVERLGFRILPVPNELVFRAAEYKASYSMSFADCFALASAVVQQWDVSFSGSVNGWPAMIGVVCLLIGLVTFLIALIRTALE